MRSILLLTLFWLSSATLSHATLELLGTWDGPEAGEQFGIALAIGGDANDDGRADLAVGSSTSDLAGDNSGKVSLYLGRAAPSQEPDLVLTGSAGSFFGAAVAWAGDVNGDGYDDLLVGAFRDSAAGANAGKAYLFLGGDPMDDSPDLVLPGPAAGSYFGRAVAGIGDLNGDTYADFAVGAPRTLNGSVQIFFGGETPDGVADLLLDGPEEGCRFGAALAGAGNADGIEGDDLLVGAPRYSAAHTWQGAAFLYSGGAAWDDLPDWEVYGEAGDQLGTAVAAAGDVNADGSPDLLIGAPYRNSGFVTDTGAAFVFYGGGALDTAADFVLEGSVQEDYLGRSVAGCGDVTGSGYDHILVGVPGSDQGGEGTGMAVLSPGGDPPVQQDLLYIQGEQAGDQFGYAVAGVARTGSLSFSGDPAPDLATGAWSHGTGGRAYVYGIAAPSGVGEETAGGGHRNGDRMLEAIVSPNPSTAFDITFRWPQGPDGGEIVARILRPDGSLIRRLVVRGSDRTGWMQARWDGRDGSGRAAAPGVYFYRLSGAGRGVVAGRVVLVE